jgi:hypothetical protein
MGLRHIGHACCSSCKLCAQRRQQHTLLERRYEHGASAQPHQHVRTLPRSIGCQSLCGRAVHERRVRRFLHADDAAVHTAQPSHRRTSAGLARSGLEGSEGRAWHGLVRSPSGRRTSTRRKRRRCSR